MSDSDGTPQWSATSIVTADFAGSVSHLHRREEVWERDGLVPRGWWPTPSGTGRVAVSVVDGLVGRSSSILRVVSLGAQAEPTDVAQLHPAALIAPHLAHYCLWDSSGSKLCYVAPDALGLGLFAWVDRPDSSPEVLTRGGPLFPAWQPGGALLALHQGTVLKVFDTANANEATILSEDAAGFRTPAFSPNGELVAYAAAGSSGVEVMVTRPDGTEARGIGKMPGGVALAFRPGSDELSAAVTTSPDTGMFDGLFLMDVEARGISRRVARGPFAACWWSPLGDRVALLVPTQSGDGRFQMRVHSAEGDLVASAEPFVPSQDFRTLTGFFDQYGVSHSLWAADGSGLLMSGRFPGDAVSAAFGDTAGDNLFLWSAGRGAPLVPLSHATVGFFVPAPEAQR